MQIIKIMVSITLLVTSSTSFCAQYKVINNGKSPVTVILDIERINDFGKAVSAGTLKAEKLQPGTSKVLKVKKNRNAHVIYLLPPLSEPNLKPLQLSNASNTSSDKKNLPIQFDADYTFVLTSQPDPKYPNSVLWTINYHTGIV
jgi:hypothetical protein